MAAININIRYFFTRIFAMLDASVGLFLLAAAFLVIAVSAYRVEILVEKSQELSRQQELNILVGARHHERSYKQLGLAGLILSPLTEEYGLDRLINEKPALADFINSDCPLNNSACKRMKVIRELTVMLAAGIQDPDEALAKITNKIAAKKLGIHESAINEWKEKTLKIMQNIKNRNEIGEGIKWKYSSIIQQKHLVEHCNPKEELSLHAKQIGDAVCGRPDPLSFSEIFIPRQIQRNLKSKTQNKSQIETKLETQTKIQAEKQNGIELINLELGVSELFEQSLQIAEFIDDECEKNNSGCLNFIQAYFISTSSILRYWHRDQIGFVTEFPTTKLWAEQPYFTHFWKEKHKTPYHSMAYIDFGGSGIVRTFCEFVDVNKLVGDPEIPIGVVCTDYTLNTAQAVSLAEVINSYSFVQAEVFEASVSQLSKNQTTLITSTKNKVNSSIPKVIKVDLPLSKLVSEVAQIKTTDKNRLMYIVPMGFNKNDILSGIIVEPVHMPSDTLLSRLYFGCFVAWAACLLLTMLFRRSSDRLDTADSLIRNLQVAVIRVDVNDNITEANDCAEELLDEALPKVGNKLKREVCFYETFIEGSAMKKVGDKYIFFDYEEIADLRSQGKTSTYFVCLKNYKTWVRVSASPELSPRRNIFWNRIFYPNKNKKTTVSFGVLQKVEEPTQKKLNKLFKNHNQTGEENV